MRPAPDRERFRPDPSLSTEEMEALQRDIADVAVFEDAFDFDAAAVCAGAAGAQTTLGDAPDAADAPVVVGVDQAFLDERSVSAVVALRDGEVVERAHATAPLDVPYVPGLLSFREGESILRAFEALETEPDLAMVDGSGRIHFREAGLATHIGVTLDLPAVGVAKSLLCGTTERSVEGLAAGERVPVTADGRVSAPEGTVIGYAFQSKQYDSPNRYVNPLYVSPGHRVGAETAVDLVAACDGGYKLPEPTRLADAYADEVKSSLGD